MGPVLAYPNRDGGGRLFRHTGNLRTAEEERRLALKDYGERYGWPQEYLKKEIESV